jgi:hypothetical protein
MPWAYLRRGLAAGLLAGTLAGLFALLFAEPILDRAIELEETSHASHSGEHHEAAPVFDRGEQKVGMIFATAIYGASGCSPSFSDAASSRAASGAGASPSPAPPFSGPCCFRS